MASHHLESHGGPIYHRKRPRIAPVAGRVVSHAALTEGEQVLDVGTGTGIVLELASPLIGQSGHVVGIDISPEMLAYAQTQLTINGLNNVSLREGGAESIPADDNSFDVVLASLSFMYVVDRAATAKEIARVLRPGGRLVGSVWTGPDQCDLVRFQQIAGRFAAAPPVPGVGPGALADPAPFLQQLADSGIDAHAETEILGFDIDSFAMTWDVFAAVTTASLSPERQQEAREAVFSEMWPDGEGPRHFRNGTQFIIGRNAG